MTISEFLKITDLDNKTADESLDIILQLTDLSLDEKRDDGLGHALFLGEELKKKKLTTEQLALLNYFLGNAWDNKRKIHPQRNRWGWEDDALGKEIICLRLALKEEGFLKLDKMRQCQILTNLANLLNEVGRASEAFWYWNKALKIEPRFSMAHANRAYGSYLFAFDLRFNEHYAIHFMQQAYFHFVQAFKRPQQIHEGAKKFFLFYFDKVKKTLSENVLKKRPKEGSLVLDDKNEETYRNWCLENKYFLNPLNDLGPLVNSAVDDLYLPPITTGIHEGPKYHGLFNQIKQEFVSARFLFYEGTHSNEVHYSDKSVYMANTFDYPSYCLAVEKVKYSFRSFYSLLDKIAFFINDYLNIGINERAISFKSLWYEMHKGQRLLRDVFVNRENRFLRAMFWLSKDLYEAQGDFGEALEPEAKALQEIRNHLEHKYLKVHEPEYAIFRNPDKNLEFMSDKLAYSILRKDFETKAERMLRFSRAAIIYLVVAIHREEQLKTKGKDKKLVAPMIVDGWDDEWKR
jgi:hypothetical protein